MDVVDLRIIYKLETGDNNTPINNGHYDAVEYIVWLEEELIKHKKLNEN